MLTVRHVAVLGLLTVATAIAAGAAVTVDEAAWLRSVSKETFLPGLSDRVGGVTKIVITRGGGLGDGQAAPGGALAEPATVTLERQNDTWRVLERDGYPAREDAVRSLLIGLSDTERLEAKTADPSRFDRLDLRDTSEAGSRATRVVAEDGAGAPILDVLIGKSRTNLSGGTRMVYARLGGASGEAGRAWLVQGEVDVRGGPGAWIDRTVVDLPRDEIAEARLTASDGSEMVLRPDGERHVIDDVPDTLRVRSIYAVDNVAAGLAALVAEDVRPVSGLEPDPALGSASFVSQGGIVVGVRFAETRASLETPPVTWTFFTIGVASKASEAAKSTAESLRNRLTGWAYDLGEIRTSRLRETLDSLTDPRS